MSADDTRLRLVPPDVLSDPPVWEDIERLALYSPAAQACVALVRRGDLTREQGLIALAYALANDYARLFNAEVERRMQEPIGRRRYWQSMETAPHETEALWWIVPKTADEAYVDTSGQPIVATFKPYIHRGKFKTWNSLSKAILWHPMPTPPDSEGGAT